MRSAFGVEHGDDVSKGIGTTFNALNSGFKLKNTVPQLPGKKNTNVTAWNIGAHAGRNKNAYGAGAAGAGAGAVGASMYNNKQYRGY
jgi:hypothetical protein